MSKTYAIAKATHTSLDSEASNLSAKLRAFPKGPMGLTLESVRLSPEYQEIKSAYDVAFQRLRAFNASFVKQFAKELRAERFARRA